MATAMVSRLAAKDGHVTDVLKERYKRMAKGGLGATVVEAAVVLPSRSSFNLRVSDEQFAIEYKELVSKIRTVSPDVKIGLQLMDFLKLSRSGWRQKVEDLKQDDIQVISGQFEVEPGFNEMTAQKEADRCLQCGMFPDKQEL